MIAMMFNPVLRNNRLLLQTHNAFHCDYCGGEASAFYQRGLESRLISNELHRELSDRACPGLFKGRAAQIECSSDEMVRSLHDYYPRSIPVEISVGDEEINWAHNPASPLVHGGIRRFAFGPILGLCCTYQGCNAPITEGVILLLSQSEILCPAHMPANTVASWRTFYLRDGNLYTSTFGYEALYRATMHNRSARDARATPSPSSPFTNTNTASVTQVLPWDQLSATDFSVRV